MAAANTRKIPLRTCITCGQTRAKRELVRIVRTPDGSLVIDDRGKLSGRGAYVCKEARCLHEAIKSRRIERALKVAVTDELAGVLLQLVGEAK